MDNLAKVLTVWLKRMPYEIFLTGKIDCMNIERKLLEEAVHTYLPNYSDTEIRHMLVGLMDSLERYAEFSGYRRMNEQYSSSVFDAVFLFADVVLVRQNNEVLCRYEKLLRWRKTTVDISEEIFVTAFYAKSDLEEGRFREDFTWPIVISHNNTQLKKITGRGMAENHFHLWGSSPYFHLSWIRLMNDIADTEFARRANELGTNIRTGYTVYDKRWTFGDMRTCCYQAALIRLFLYGRLTDTKFELGTYYIEWECLLPWMKTLDGKIEREYFESLCSDLENETTVSMLGEVFKKAYENNPQKKKEMVRLLPELRWMLEKNVDFSKMENRTDRISVCDILQFVFQRQEFVRLSYARCFFEEKEFSNIWWCKTLEQVSRLLDDQDLLERHIDEVQNIIDGLKLQNSTEIDDYALAAHNFKYYNDEQIYYSQSGERHIIYEMFRRILKHDKSLSSQMYNMFYAYLLIKERIRGELVQSNQWVGFENFQIYQDRKWYFLRGEKYSKLAAKMAVLSCLQQDVIRLEIRINPNDSAEEYYENVRFLDNAIDKEGKLRNKFFYVIHFIKRPDNLIINDKFCECRHNELRIDCERKTRAFIEFRKKYKMSAFRILGIDAASQEIGCRPEVFGSVFRTLQQDTRTVLSEKGLVRIPQLRATYHVGEDFLDVTDGLRAIDEAILFLDLDCGDRLGHALALGISVKKWYESKRYHISLPLQDYLDNLVWLYHSIVRYKIYCLDNLKSFIEAEFQKYFSEIYGKNMDQNFIKAILNKSGKAGYFGNLNFDINTYYDAWRVRGDNPVLYQEGYFKEPAHYFSSLELNGVNHKFPEDFEIRRKPEVGILYYYYHYNVDVRIAGQKEKNFRVNEDYIKGVELVQKAMQKEVAKRGIAIEANPSSNCMIGTFDRYDEHPITVFYNNGLSCRLKELEESAQIWVSINTDDQGVFGTVLQNEYALMANALERKTDENGQNLYSKTMIYDWLDKVREMGISQSFYSNVQEEITGDWS